MNAYLEYDPDVFRDKVVLLPCDDPEWSNFTKFFALHFVGVRSQEADLHVLRPRQQPGGRIDYQPTLFESDRAPRTTPARPCQRQEVRARSRKDINGDGVVNIDDLQWEYLEGDGDFRSPEVTALRDEADIVITNPPFSLFRPFMTWLFEGGKQVLRDRQQKRHHLQRSLPAHQGEPCSGRAPRHHRHGDREFGVSGRRYPLEAAESSASDETTGEIHPSHGVRWFTNIDHGRRHEPLQLMTMADNIKFSKHKEVRGVGYPPYDNFDAIEVPFTDAIPSDYDGMMGVPITFLDKYNPDQFEIVGSSEGDYKPTKTYGPKERVVDGVRMKSNTGSLACYVRVEAFGPGTYVRRWLSREDASTSGCSFGGRTPREDRAEALHGRAGPRGFRLQRTRGQGSVRPSWPARHPARVPAQLHLQRRQEGRRRASTRCSRATRSASSTSTSVGDTLEVLDGQQRITSVGRFVTGKFAIRVDGKEQTFSSLPLEEQQKIRESELLHLRVRRAPRRRSRSGSRRSTSPACR